MSEGVRGDSSALDVVKAELRAKGYRWFFFGKTRHAPEDENRYWFNGSKFNGEGRQILAEQPYGYFTLDEMRAEKFAEGIRIAPHSGS